MIEPNLRLQKYLEGYVDWLEKLNDRSVSLLDDMCASNISFDGPYHAVQGANDVCSIFEARLLLGEQFSFHVYDFAWGRGEGVANLYWQMSFCASQRAQLIRKRMCEVSVDGMSRLMFLPGGKIFSIQDFWGEHDPKDFNRYSSAL